MENILIIEDEKSLLDLLSVVLKKEGYRVKTCLAPTKVFDILENEELDLLICDIKLPQNSGMEGLKYVRENRPEIPVIMITAYGSLKQAVEALKAGAIDYILKPFDVEELKIIIARALHLLSRRGENPFVSINCAALPENLLESELFGHARGSFTGAVADKKGMFEVAARGTLFP